MKRWLVLSKFSVEEFTVDKHDISFEISGPKGANLGAKLLSRLSEMDEHSFREFVQKTGDLDEATTEGDA